MPRFSVEVMGWSGEPVAEFGPGRLSTVATQTAAYLGLPSVARWANWMGRMMGGGGEASTSCRFGMVYLISS